MKFPDLGAAAAGDIRILRTAAMTFIAAVGITALYLGRDVLLPAAIAVLFAFILGPALTWVRRLLPAPLAVTTVVLGAVLVVGLLTVLIMAQLAEVAGSLTSYQTNLQQKIHDIRALSEGGGALSRFIAMVASLGHDLALTTGPAAVPTPAVQVQSSSNFESVAVFIAPLLHPLLTIGIVIILVVFILLDRDHLNDQFVRLFGASDVHATSEAIGDAAGRVARVLALQLMTNFGFAVAVGGGLFLLGMPNPLLWGLLAGGFRFVPYVGAALGAVLPTLIAFAVLPGWLQPLLVLGWIVGCDIIIGQIVEPLLFGESTGITPLALIMSALFWGTLWGPIGLLLSTPLTICLLVLGRHVPHLGFLQILLGAEPALAPYQQIYRRLIRRAVAEASTVAAAEIEEKGRERGLDDGMGRMVVLAEADRAQDRLSATQVEAIVEGTDDVLDFLTAEALDDQAGGPAASLVPRELPVFFHCVGGRGQVDEAAAALIAFALRQSGLQADTQRRSEPPSGEGQESAPPIVLMCYASHPSEAVRRYTLRKLTLGGGAGRARHLVIDYDVAPVPSPSIAGMTGPGDLFAGDLAALCRLSAQHAVSLGRVPTAMSAA
ncbi:hypothetical protein BH11PSE3_BH11PSE3_28400 [soil metagenome]